MFFAKNKTAYDFLTCVYKALLGFHNLWKVPCLGISEMYTSNLSKDINFYFTIGIIIFTLDVQNETYRFLNNTEFYKK